MFVQDGSQFITADPATDTAAFTETANRFHRRRRDSVRFNRKAHQGNQTRPHQLQVLVVTLGSNALSPENLIVVVTCATYMVNGMKKHGTA